MLKGRLKYWILIIFMLKKAITVLLKYLISRKKITKPIQRNLGLRLTIEEFLKLLYIELTISFLIGQKRTVNFRIQRPWRHNCR